MDIWAHSEEIKKDQRAMQRFEGVLLTISDLIFSHFKRFTQISVLFTMRDTCCQKTRSLSSTAEIISIDMQSVITHTSRSGRLFVT